MFIATRISRLFNDSESAERIISASDCPECRDWCINSEYPKQHLFHFDLNIIHPYYTLSTWRISRSYEPNYEGRFL